MTSQQIRNVQNFVNYQGDEDSNSSDESMHDFKAGIKFLRNLSNTLKCYENSAYKTPAVRNITYNSP